jgi:hypothetical protein
MNYPGIIIAALAIFIVLLINKNRILRIENENLYTPNDITIKLSQSSAPPIRISYFIRVRKERNFDINLQLDFIMLALKTAGYGSDTFRESEFRALVKHRGLESVIIEPE